MSIAKRTFQGCRETLRSVKRFNYIFYRVRELEARLSEVERFQALQSSLEDASTLGLEDFCFPQEQENEWDGSGSWRVVGGAPGTRSWEGLGYLRARAMASFDNELIVGLDGGKEGKAAVYRLRRGAWEKIGGAGLRGGWTGGVEAHSLAVQGGALYAGVSSSLKGPELWSFDGEAWRLVADAGSAGWNKDKYFSISAITPIDGGVVFALSNRDPGPSLKSCATDTDYAAIYLHRDGETTRLFDGRHYAGAPYICAYDLLAASDGYVYAGMLSMAGAFGDCYRMDVASGSCERIGGRGLNGGWRYAPDVLRIREHQGQIVAITDRTPMALSRYSSVWTLTADGWRQVGSATAPEAWRDMYSFNALETFRGALILGAGGRPAGKASVWRLARDNSWRLLGGRGVQQSWSRQLIRKQHAPLHSSQSTEYVYQFCALDDALYAGFGASRECAQVWRLDPAESRD